MSFNNSFSTPDLEATRARRAAGACPVCGSSSIVTTAKKPDADSYWRCESCGEVWNVARRHSDRQRARSWR